VVPPSGNMMIGPQQFWLGTSRAGQTVTLWMDTTTVHLSIGGWRVKTVPSRLTEVDLARLRRAGARPAGPLPRARSRVPWRPAGAWKWTGWSTPPGSSPSATRSSRSAPRWPGSAPASLRRLAITGRGTVGVLGIEVPFTYSLRLTLRDFGAKVSILPPIRQERRPVPSSHQVLVRPALTFGFYILADGNYLLVHTAADRCGWVLPSSRR
jgi:hypothetical protein